MPFSFLTSLPRIYTQLCPKVPLSCGRNIIILLVRVQQPTNVEKHFSPLVFALRVLIRSIASNSFTTFLLFPTLLPRILTPSKKIQDCDYVRRCNIMRGGRTAQRSHRIVLTCVPCPSDKITYLCVVWCVVCTSNTGRNGLPWLYSLCHLFVSAMSTISWHLRRLESQFAIFQKDVPGKKLAACARRGSIQSKSVSVSETYSTQHAMDPVFRLESNAIRLTRRTGLEASSVITAVYA